MTGLTMYADVGVASMHAAAEQMAVGSACMLVEGPCAARSSCSWYMDLNIYGCIAAGCCDLWFESHRLVVLL